MMTTQKPHKKRSLFILMLLTLSAFTFSACLKENKNDQQSILSALTVINGAPDAPGFDFVLNRQLVQPQNCTYAKRINYFLLNSGTYNASFYEHQTNSNPLFETSITLKDGKYHSLFLAGTLTDSLTSLLIEDDLTSPKGDQVKVRFINLSPDAGALDFSMVQDSLFASKKAFLEYSDFYEMPSGEYQASFKSSTGAQINHEFTLKLTAGKIYTVWARGLVETEEEDQAFENGLIIHDL